MVEGTTKTTGTRKNRRDELGRRALDLKAASFIVYEEFNKNVPVLPVAGRGPRGSPSILMHNCGTSACASCRIEATFGARVE
ncbi:hypothetical protein WG66_006651, partial [Moniliophthora roreri]